ncbi:unnamed protein product, partial [Nesidiocoris tenuis]
LPRCVIRRGWSTRSESRRPPELPAKRTYGMQQHSSSTTVPHSRPSSTGFEFVWGQQLLSQDCPELASSNRPCRGRSMLISYSCKCVVIPQRIADTAETLITRHSNVMRPLDLSTLLSHNLKRPRLTSSVAAGKPIASTPQSHYRFCSVDLPVIIQSERLASRFQL